MRSVWKREEVAAGLVRVRPLLEGLAEPQAGAAGVAAPPASSKPPSWTPDETVSRHLRLLNALAAAMVRGRTRELGDLRPDLLRLVLLVCQELLGREVAADPSIVEHTLRQALEGLDGATSVTARLHPDDVVFLQERWEALPPSERSAPLQLVADDSIRRGECRLESDRGDIDATWETQLRLVREALTWGVDDMLE